LNKEKYTEERGREGEKVSCIWDEEREKKEQCVVRNEDHTALNKRTNIMERERENVWCIWDEEREEKEDDALFWQLLPSRPGISKRVD